MIHIKTTVLFSILISLLSFCSPAPKQSGANRASIPVAGEKLFLAPMVSEKGLEELKRWPRTPEQQKILLKNFSEIHDRLESELQKCGKYGLYEMVNDSYSSTIRITITITSVCLEKDTLKMPLQLMAERIVDGNQYIYTIPAFGTVSNLKMDNNTFHYFGLLLADYKRRFPRQLIAGYFYPLDSAPQ